MVTHPLDTPASPASADRLNTDPGLHDAARRFAEAAAAWSRGPAHAATELPAGLQELLAVLGAQAEWRVLVDGTRNFGHQASTVLLLQRLIELTGFSGRVVVVYIDHGRALLGCTAEKLALMFPGTDPARLDEAVASHGSCPEIRFLPYARRTALREAVAFGFTGGADDLALNAAAELQTRFFLRLQPYLWDDPPSARHDAYYQGSRIEQPDGRHLLLLEAWPALQQLAIHPPRGAQTAAPAVWAWYSRQQTFDPGLARRCRNLHTLLALQTARDPAEDVPVAPPTPWLWPIYGLQHFAEQAGEMLLTCVLAATRCARVAQRPVLLCLFSPHHDIPGWSRRVDALAVEQTLRSVAGTRPTGPQTGDGPVPVRVHRACDPATGRWADISATLELALCSGPVPAVHVVELGPVPMALFHHALSQADLPPLIEGQAAANLLSASGRAFLQVLREEHVIKNGYARPPCDAAAALSAETAAGLARTLRDLRLAADGPGDSPAGGNQTERHGATLHRIAHFLLDARTPGSHMATYFAQLGRHFAQARHDKLLLGLLALREVMLAESPADAPPDARAGSSVRSTKPAR